MKVLALDIATRFGYALWDDSIVGGLASSGFGQLPNDGPPGKRFAAFHAALRKLAPEVQRIAYEDAWHQQGKAGAVFGGLLAMVQVHAYQVGATLHACPVSTVKKHATGSGKADKAAMMQAATARWGVECETDDHGDALCVLAYSLEIHGLLKGAPRAAEGPHKKRKVGGRRVSAVRSEI